MARAFQHLVNIEHLEAGCQVSCQLLEMVVMTRDVMNERVDLEVTG